MSVQKPNVGGSPCLKSSDHLCVLRSSSYELQGLADAGIAKYAGALHAHEMFATARARVLELRLHPGTEYAKPAHEAFS